MMITQVMNIWVSFIFPLYIYISIFVLWFHLSNIIVMHIIAEIPNWLIIVRTILKIKGDEGKMFEFT